jgi:hypothetical protein
MKVAIFYNPESVEAPLAAYSAWAKYYAQFDSNNDLNDVTVYNVDGLSDANVHTLIYGLSSDYHRIVNFTTTGTGTGQISSDHITDLAAKLIGSSVDALSDDKVITIPPATFPASLDFGRNQAQNAWNIFYSYKGNPSVKGNATAGGADTLTDSTLDLTVDAYIGYYLYIISGTGVGQYRLIESNTKTIITVRDAWDTNPDNTSVYHVSQTPPKPFPFAINYIGGGDSSVTNGTASGGSTSTLVDSGSGWTVDAYADYYAYIYDGTGVGQSRRIVSNTADTLTLASPVLDAAVDGTSKYIIVNNEFEILWWEYANRWLWLYAWDLSDSVHLKNLAKLLNNLNNINSQGVEEPSVQDVDFWNNTVLVQGKSIFEAALIKPAPIAPTPLTP